MRRACPEDGPRSNFWSVSSKHFDAERNQILDSLTLGMGGSPKLQILDPVVGALAVAVMNHLVRTKRATDVPCHHQSMFTNIGRSPDQVAEFSRDPNYPVSMIHVAVSGHLTNGLVWLRISSSEDPLVMGRAESPGLVWPKAVGDRTKPAWFPKRLLADRPISKQSLIVAMAITPRFGVFVTIRGPAPRLLPLDRAGRPWISRSQHPSVVHLANAPGVDAPIAALDRAFPHGLNVRAGWDRNGIPVTSARGC